MMIRRWTIPLFAAVTMTSYSASSGDRMPSVVFARSSREPDKFINVFCVEKSAGVATCEMADTLIQRHSNAGLADIFIRSIDSKPGGAVAFCKEMFKSQQPSSWNDVRAACATGKTDAVKASLRAYEQSYSQTCSIVVSHWASFDFTKTSPGTWMAKHSGACADDVFTLTSPPGDGIIWAFRIARIWSPNPGCIGNTGTAEVTDYAKAVEPFDLACRWFD